MFYLLLLIITIPSFFSLVQPWHFTIHDNAHVARLYLMDQAVRQGQLFPRWVDVMGFGFGYPLFNFYPSLIYYIALVFRFLGASYSVAINLMIASGFILGSVGMFLLGSRITRSRVAGLVAAALYTFFTYHAVLVYVRGALAEFFAMSLLPFVFLSLHALREKVKVSQALLFGLSFALLTLSHPLIAFPSVLFIGLLVGHLFLSEKKERLSFLLHSCVGGLVGLGLSAFFWLPAMVERTLTVVNSISVSELFNYKLHFVSLSQFWYSPWGFGGSAAGGADGMSFQLGKIHILLFILSVLVYLFTKKGKDLTQEKRHYRGYLIFCLIALFMCLPYSGFIWERLSFLQFMQFPWRFLTFVGVFISLVGAYCVAFLPHLRLLPKYKTWMSWVGVGIVTLGVVFQYGKYFIPSAYIKKTDAELTAFHEIAWNVSRATYDFLPTGTPFKKATPYNVSVFDITEEDLPRPPYQIERDDVNVNQVKNFFTNKQFEVTSPELTQFTLTTFNFPGWSAYLDDVKMPISDNNPYKLISVEVPSGTHEVSFLFEDTFVRKLANALSTATVSVCFLLLFLESQKKKKSR